MHNTDKRTNKLVAAGIIGAAYAALTIVLGDFGYGPIQLRLSEALCILPFFFPASAWGLFAGCAVANLVGGYGLPDIVFGSLATLLACLCTARIGVRSMAITEKGRSVGWKSCVAACAMPVVFNIPIIGAMLSYMIGEMPFWTGFAIFGAQVGLGEAIVMFAVGFPLMRVILKNAKLMEFMKSF